MIRKFVRYFTILQDPKLFSSMGNKVEKNNSKDLYYLTFGQMWISTFFSIVSVAPGIIVKSLKMHLKFSYLIVKCPMSKCYLLLLPCDSVGSKWSVVVREWIPSFSVKLQCLRFVHSSFQIMHTWFGIICVEKLSNRWLPPKVDKQFFCGVKRCPKGQWISVPILHTIFYIMF